ncbi:Phenyloxazoline synthase MbtB [Pandoraea terrae]|uniref:Phenyloxazoline synthase MbtB n=1 Tax=Pandoraea terrae TaxID=1537710 RepID=A0A5E4S7N3_9BURK|nr:3-hydroxylacyl-ACP dehydratase [Pandoraea terrae]VVD71211.1 Phenyloxazoline synthase MbtB [Pandoraea terrae]
MTERLTLALRVPDDHPAFPGHFPAQPILPGAALLDLIVEALRESLGRAPGALALASAKFLAPVGPGSQLSVTAVQTASGRWRCSAHDACGAKVAQCEFDWGGAA